MNILDRYLGCLLGGAAGDALGAPVEFMKRPEILQRFGLAGITRYASAYGGVGLITDDTQMTLFTAEGLLRAWVRGISKGITTYEGVTRRAYLRWLRTQGERLADTDEQSDDSGWLVAHRDLHHRRAPGNTCLAALRASKPDEIRARNSSKGCGGVMRVAPVGLFMWRLGEPLHRTFELAANLAALTHGHPTGYLAAGVLGVTIQRLLDGANLTSALADAKACLREHEHHAETLRAIESAESLALETPGDPAAVARLGAGWVAEEALAISIYCSVCATSFEAGVVLAVNHDGDSDSTGAIAGNLLGTMLGSVAIPDHWLEGLELRRVISEVAADLYHFVEWHDDEALWEKYPGY